MELKIRNGDYIADGIGGERRADGAEALLERALFRLSVRRGSFPFLPELGSELYRLGHEKPSARAAAAKLYTAAALAEETALTVEDVEAGAGGNVIAGTVTLLSAMPVGVVQCTNPAAFSGGCDAESDEALRGRVLASYQRLPNGANAAYYEQEAMRYPGVAAAKAVGRARGIGTVNVVIATPAGVPDAALLAAVEMDLQKKREIAVDVKVLAPTVETVAVTAALKAAPGYTFAEVKAGAQSALEALFTGGLLGKNVTTARLLTLLCGVEGVENVHLTAPAADVAVGSTELPMLGTVTISELTEA